MDMSSAVTSGVAGFSVGASLVTATQAYDRGFRSVNWMTSLVWGGLGGAALGVGTNYLIQKYIEKGIPNRPLIFGSVGAVAVPVAVKAIPSRRGTPITSLIGWSLVGLIGFGTIGLAYEKVSER